MKESLLSDSWGKSRLEVFLAENGDGKERLKKWLKIETTDGAIKIAEAA